MYLLDKFYELFNVAVYATLVPPEIGLRTEF